MNKKFNKMFVLAMSSATLLSSGSSIVFSQIVKADSFNKKDSIIYTPKGKTLTETKKQIEERVLNELKEKEVDVFYILDVSYSREDIINKSLSKTMEWFKKYPKMNVKAYTYDIKSGFLPNNFKAEGNFTTNQTIDDLISKADNSFNHTKDKLSFVIFESDLKDFMIEPSYGVERNDEKLDNFMKSFMHNNRSKSIVFLDNRDDKNRPAVSKLPKFYKDSSGNIAGYVVDSELDRDVSLSDAFTKIVSNTKNVETKRTVYPKYSIKVEKDNGIDLSMTLNGKSVSDGYSFTPSNTNPLKLDISANIKNTTAKEQHAKVSLLEDGKVVSSKTLSFAGTSSTSKKEVIKASTSYKANPNLKYGEKKTITTAKDGQKEIITTTNIVNGKSQSKTSEKILSNPVNGVIEVGNKKVTTTPIDFKSTTKTDPNMMKGQSKIERTGKKGLKTVTTIYEVKASDGSLINPKSTEKVDAAIDEIKVIGSKVVNKEDINFKTIYKADGNLKYGEKKTKTEGIKGQKEIVYNGDKKVSEKVVKEPVDKIILVGNKKVEKSPIDFKSTTKTDPNMMKGQSKIERAGKKGLKIVTTVYEVKANDGSLINPNSTEKIDKAIDEIKVIGSKSVNKEDIEFKTIYKADDSLAFDEKKVQTEGVKGQKEIVYDGNKKLFEKTIKEPIDKVVLIGNKSIETEEIEPIEGGIQKGIKTTTSIFEVEELTGKLINPKVDVKTVYPFEEIEDVATDVKKHKEVIKFDTVYVADASLEYGKTKVFQEGQDGEKEITITSKVVDGKRATEKEEKILKKSTPKIISVGSIKTDLKDVDFKTIKEKSKEDKKGEEKVKQEGLKGVEETKTVYEVNKETGKLENEKVSKKIIKDPVDKIILVGITELKEIPFETVYEADENLEYGKKEVKQKGVKGLKEVYVDVDLKDEKALNDFNISSDKKSNSNSSENKVVDEKTQSNLDEVKDDKKDLVSNDKSNDKNLDEKIIKEPVKEIIKVGNKKSSKEEIPFKVIEQKDDSLKKGETKIKTKGVKGEKEIIEISEVDPKTGELKNPKKKEKVIKEKVDEIKLIGTKEEKEEVFTKEGKGSLPKTGQTIIGSLLGIGSIIGGAILKKKNED